ncbi:MAG: transposase, partial [Waddliaceae bacterium]
EKKRNSLKFLCPAAHYGITCKGAANCPVRKGLRIPLNEDLRVFTPVARSSYKWKRLYNKRTSVERVNSRIDVSFGFERHFIRGLAKMRLRCGLALCVMLAMALGRVKQNKFELMRSLVKVA